MATRELTALETSLRTRRDGGGRAFVPYVTGGLEIVDADLLRGLAAAGADAIEVGVPFSDPVMDGGVVQEASRRALEGGATLASVLATVREAALDVPVALMTYLNPILRHGAEAYLSAAADAGVSGVIVPDLPVDEGDEWVRACLQAAVSPVFLASPGSTTERLARIGSASGGFVYCVATYGVTGERDRLAGTAEELVAALRPVTDLPLLVGVGIATPEQAAQACAFADGAIVGSALVRQLLEGDRMAALELAARLPGRHPRLRALHRGRRQSPRGWRIRTPRRGTAFPVAPPPPFVVGSTRTGREQGGHARVLRSTRVRAPHDSVKNRRGESDEEPQVLRAARPVLGAHARRCRMQQRRGAGGGETAPRVRRRPPAPPVPSIVTATSSAAWRSRRVSRSTRPPSWRSRVTSRSLGTDSNNGVMLAIDNLDDALDGNDRTAPRPRRRAVQEDDLCSAEGGQQGATALAADPTVVAVFGTSCSSAALGVADTILSDKGYLTISPSNTNPGLTSEEAHQPFYLRTAHNDKIQGAIVAEFVFNELGITTAATINDESPYADGLAAAFRANFEALGGDDHGQEAGPAARTRTSGRCSPASPRGSRAPLLPGLQPRVRTHRGAGGGHHAGTETVISDRTVAWRRTSSRRPVTSARRTTRRRRT